MARRRSRRRAPRGSGLGLGLFILAMIALVMRDHWPWLVGVGSLIAIAWIWAAVRRWSLAASLEQIDQMTGREFERYLVKLFRRLGYRARHMGGPGDFGADLVVERDGISIAVQAKNYGSGKVGNDAVQQAIAGATYHNCDMAMVVTNSRYTKAAREQAEKSSLPCTLWDRDQLKQALEGKSDR